MSLSITRKTDYALVALTGLAARGANARQPISARALANRHGLPARVATNVLKQLHTAGLLRSQRGAAGGYWLAREPGSISVADVVEAIEGPIALSVCCGSAAEPTGEACEMAHTCLITNGVRQLNDAVATMVSKVTLEDLLEGRVDVSPAEPRRSVSLPWLHGVGVGRDEDERPGRAAPRRRRAPAGIA